MTNLAQRAVANTEHCEVRKIAYRQSKDGIVVSFVIHPNEVPEGLTLAALGTRYMLALVAIDDNEEPKEVMQHPRREEHKTTPRQSSSQELTQKTGGAKSPAQMAGILCNDPVFRKFLTDKCTHPLANGGVMHVFRCETAEDAAQNVREICCVSSRKEITTENRGWTVLVSSYRAWQLAPQVGA